MFALYKSYCIKAYSFCYANRHFIGYLVLFLGVVLLTFGFTEIAYAQAKYTIKTDNFVRVICPIFKYTEGPLGATLLVVTGISALVSFSQNNYKTSLMLLAVAAGAFIMHSLVKTFFGPAVASC